MRTAYHQALEVARLDVVHLGMLAIEALRNAATALEKCDAALAARVIAGDDLLDEKRRKVEATCIELIWRQQPVAGELRQVAAMLQTVTDLERIGDYAADIAKNAIKLIDMPRRPAGAEIEKTAAIATEMLTQAVRSYNERDGETASRVIAQDDQVDKLYHRGIEALQEEMAADPTLVRAGTLTLLILGALERAGDRAQNIAWHTKEMLGIK